MAKIYICYLSPLYFLSVPLDPILDSKNDFTVVLLNHSCSTNCVYADLTPGPRRTSELSNKAECCDKKRMGNMI